ncbi:MAG: hypothetical protein ACRC8S_09690 [Fimbriiglobus sp.]
MGWFSRFRDWATQNPAGRVDDLLLGPLVLNDSWWEAQVVANGLPVCLQIGGRNEPDAELVARARHLVAGLDEFAARVSGFLAAEADQPEWFGFTDEIRALVIREICLFWPNRPDEGMVFFEGSGWRCWRCDLIRLEPTSLAYDS